MVWRKILDGEKSFENPGKPRNEDSKNNRNSRGFRPKFPMFFVVCGEVPCSSALQVVLFLRYKAGVGKVGRTREVKRFTIHSLSASPGWGGVVWENLTSAS